jgi:PAS domain S-box-containing protein
MTGEDERLAALQAYAILDTGAEPAFDHLAAIAARLLDVPIALVTFVDASRQWFKAKFGLDLDETPRAVSFCAKVVEGDAPLVVVDAAADPRFSANPLVVGAPFIRFYAGMPLRTAKGFVVGAVCALDSVPRAPTVEQLDSLQKLADLVVAQLEARTARNAVAREREVAQLALVRLRLVLDTMAEGVVVQDATGAITSANRCSELILGLTLDQLQGRTSIDPRWRSVRENGEAFPGDEHPAMVSLRTGEPLENVLMGVHKPEGTLTWIRVNSMPRLVDGTPVEVVTTFHDETVIKLATERAAQQERLATVGTLAAGVGHEINNPLAFVLGNLDYAIEEVRSIAGPSPSARLKDLAALLVEAKGGADRIRKIVRGLRALARDEVVLSSIDFHTIVDTSLSMAAHEIKLKASTFVELQELPSALADESRITQVLVNLLVNAAQAFESADPETNRIVLTSGRRGDGRVMLSVSDNGPGIPGHLATRIFDPFFTTKPVGQGTGLGLSVSRNLVEALGGELVMSSEEGKGATFSIVLPLAPNGGGTASSRRGGAEPRGRVLVVDDEVSVVGAVRRLLSREHDVVGCSDPREALRAIEANEEFDCIFCDVMMPYLTGPELFARSCALRPELAPRFVFITGAASSPSVQAFLSEVSNERLEKPFSSQELRRVARRLTTYR